MHSGVSERANERMNEGTRLSVAYLRARSNSKRGKCIE